MSISKESVLANEKIIEVGVYRRKKILSIQNIA